MSDRAMMLRETVEAYADLHAILDGLTEEQAGHIRLGVVGMLDLVTRWPGMLRECSGQMLETTERVHKARMAWAPGSFWGLRHRDDQNDG